jgi:hypothetical protein
MRTGLEKSAQPRGRFRNSVGSRNADRIETVLARSLRKLRLQRFRPQKSRSA